MRMWAFNNNCKVKLNLLFENAININIRVNFGLTCDPLSEDLDESDVIVGSGSVSLKHKQRHIMTIRLQVLERHSVCVYMCNYNHTKLTLVGVVHPGCWTEQENGGPQVQELVKHLVLQQKQHEEE